MEPILPASTGSYVELNWRSWDSHVRALQAWTAGHRTEALELVEECLNLSLADAGLTDDYPVQMPRLMWIVLEARDFELGGSVVAQIEGAPKGLDCAGLHAYAHTFRGLLGCLSGEETESAEIEVRQGIAELEAYGAIPDRAIAQEHLARWLIEQGRSVDAAPLLEAARSTYAELGATAWLERLDSLSRVG